MAVVFLFVLWLTLYSLLFIGVSCNKLSYFYSLEQNINEEYNSQRSHINRYKFDIFLNNETKCDSEKPVELVVLIKSYVKEWDSRDAIRKSWGQDDFYGKGTMRKIFILGKPSSNEDWERILEESTKNGDIVMFDCDDGLLSSTNKFMASLKWAMDTCPQTKYFINTWTDTYISVKNYLEFARTDGKKFCNFNEPPKAMYAGFIYHNGIPKRKDNDLAVSYSEYPYSIYPDYNGAVGMIISRKTAELFYFGSFFTKHFSFSGEYAGILAEKLGIMLQNCRGFSDRVPTKIEDYKDILTAGYFISSSLTKLWSDLKDHKYV